MGLGSNKHDLEWILSSLTCSNALKAQGAKVGASAE